jgi:hypothetical protein
MSSRLGWYYEQLLIYVIDEPPISLSCPDRYLVNGAWNLVVRTCSCNFLRLKRLHIVYLSISVEVYYVQAI